MEGVPCGARKRAGRANRSRSPGNPEQRNGGGVVFRAGHPLPRCICLGHNGAPTLSPRAAHGAPSATLRWPSSPTREAYSRVTESRVSLLFVRPVDGDTGSPSATVRGRKCGKPLRSGACSGSTRDEASLVGEGDRRRRWRGSPAARGNRLGEEDDHAVRVSTKKEMTEGHSLPRCICLGHNGYETNGVYSNTAEATASGKYLVKEMATWFSLRPAT